MLHLVPLGDRGCHASRVIVHYFTNGRLPGLRFRPSVSYNVRVFIITGPLGPHLGIEVDLAEVIHAAGGTVVKAIPGDRNPQRTVLIQESDGTSDRGARDRCESLGIPVRNMQWVLDLISRQEAPEFDA